MSSFTPLPSLSIPSPATSPGLVHMALSRSACLKSTPPSNTATIGSPVGLGGLGGSTGPAVLQANSRPQFFSVPVSARALSSTDSVQVPLADSPLKAVLKSNEPFTSSALPPWRSDTVAVLPDGLVSFTTRSPLYVCDRSRFSFSESSATSWSKLTVDVTVWRSFTAAFGVAEAVSVTGVDASRPVRASLPGPKAKAVAGSTGALGSGRWPVGRSTKLVGRAAVFPESKPSVPFFPGRATTRDSVVAGVSGRVASPVRVMGDGSDEGLRVTVMMRLRGGSESNGLSPIVAPRQEQFPRDCFFHYR